MGRPEEMEPLLVLDYMDDNGQPQMYYRDATVDEVLAAVRAGVESGTIEGEVVEWCEVHADRNMPWLEKADQNVCRWAVKVNGEKDCRIVSKLLIPVPDGGSET